MERIGGMLALPGSPLPLSAFWRGALAIELRQVPRGGTGLPGCRAAEFNFAYCRGGWTAQPRAPPPDSPDPPARWCTQSIENAIFCRGRFFEKVRWFFRKLSALQSRRFGRPRSSRLQHSASFRTTKPNKASMTSMLAAASIQVMDALFGFVA